MTVSLPDEYLAAHYPNVWERMADRWVHIVALSAFGAGSAGLVWLAAERGKPGLIVAAALYGAALIAMLAFSAAYNLSRVTRSRPFLRRLDTMRATFLIAGGRAYHAFHSAVHTGRTAPGR